MVRVIIICILLAGCQTKFLITKNNDSNLLKMNGYYFRIYQSPFGCGNYFFYANGVTRYGMATDSCNVSKLKENIQNLNTPSRGDITTWGVFTINKDSSIIWKKWESAEGAPVSTRTGKVLNNSTFIITEIKVQGFMRKSTVSDTFHFAPLLIKPDSISKYIRYENN